MPANTTTSPTSASPTPDVSGGRGTDAHELTLAGRGAGQVERLEREQRVCQHSVGGSWSGNGKGRHTQLKTRQTKFDVVLASVICCCTWFQSTLVALPTTPSGPSSRRCHRQHLSCRRWLTSAPHAAAARSRGGALSSCDCARNLKSSKGWVGPNPGIIILSLCAKLYLQTRDEQREQQQRCMRLGIGAHCRLKAESCPRARAPSTCGRVCAKSNKHQSQTSTCRCCGAAPATCCYLGTARCSWRRLRSPRSGRLEALR